MTVRLIGANPGMRLYEGDRLTGYASAWRVDWSEHGAGNALVLWRDDTTRVISSEPELGQWLAHEFTRHFPEVHGLPWPDPEVTNAPITWESDLSRGVRVTGADVSLEIAEPMARRWVTVDDFDLGGTPHRLSTVLMPCRRATLWIGGTRVPGAPRTTTQPRLTATAFLADAEVWCTGQE